MTTSAARISSPLVAIVCSECGKGTYDHYSDAYAARVYECGNRSCRSEITISDLTPNLEAGEFLSLNAAGTLCVVTADIIPF